MKSTINNAFKEDFYIKLYFDSSVDFHFKGLKRAYLDFSRTLYKNEETHIERQKKTN